MEPMEIRVCDGGSVGDEVAIAVREFSTILKQELHTITKAHSEYLHLVVLVLNMKVRSR